MSTFTGNIGPEEEDGGGWEHLIPRRHRWIRFSDGTAKCSRCGLSVVEAGKAVEDRIGCDGP